MESIKIEIRNVINFYINKLKYERQTDHKNPISVCVYHNGT